MLQQAASVLRTSSVLEWAAVAKKLWTDGLDAIESIYFNFFPTPAQEKENASDQARKSQESQKKTLESKSRSHSSPKTFDIFKRFLSRNKADNSVAVSTETLERKQRKELQEEVAEYSVLVSSQTFKESSWSTKEFWLKHKQQFPKLFQLALILSNVPTSTAFIERFFSICGVICKKRMMNMDDDLLIARCLFKANLTLLKELNQAFLTKEKTRET